MTLYVRADVASVRVPPTSGGCGEPHVRPVVAGVPVHRNDDGSLAPWPITCPQCETDLKQDILRAGGKKVRTQNPDAGMKLADRYLGLFGATADMIPESPDEEKHREAMEQKSAKDQASKSAQLAETSALSLNSISAAIQGNSELMAKFMELQAALIANHRPVAAEPELAAPRQFEYTVGALPLMADCKDCGQPFARTSNKGPAPKRCPDCKAKAAA